MNNLLSVNDIEKITNIPSTTIRRYVKNHNEYIQTKRKGNLHFIYDSEIPVLEKIRLLYESGKNHAEITAILENDVGKDMNKSVANIMMKHEDDDRKLEREDASNETLLALQSSVESIEKKHVKLLEDLMTQVKRVEESKAFAIELLEKQIESKNDKIAELEAKIRGFEIMLSAKEVAATSMSELEEEDSATAENVIEKRSLYDRFFKFNKVMQKNA
ncbi:hypothetical protein [Bacillus sp. JJ722]|uniref:hypothetical protein n=1 Tax=Bacillus sp. JJ722 TaxID=3122973 RepID=UPI002FFD9983